MKQLHRFFWLIPILLAAACIWAAYKLIYAFLSYASALPKEIGASLIAATATVFVATLTVVLGRYFERKKELDALHREKKTEMYDEFLKKLFDFFTLTRKRRLLPKRTT